MKDCNNGRGQHKTLPFLICRHPMPDENDSQLQAGTRKTSNVPTPSVWKDTRTSKTKCFALLLICCLQPFDMLWSSAATIKNSMRTPLSGLTYQSEVEVLTSLRVVPLAISSRRSAPCRADSSAHAPASRASLRAASPPGDFACRKKLARSGESPSHVQECVCVERRSIR